MALLYEHLAYRMCQLLDTLALRAVLALGLTLLWIVVAFFMAVLSEVRWLALLAVGTAVGCGAFALASFLAYHGLRMGLKAVAGAHD